MKRNLWRSFDLRSPQGPQRCLLWFQHLRWLGTGGLGEFCYPFWSNHHGFLGKLLFEQSVIRCNQYSFWGTVNICFFNQFCLMSSQNFVKSKPGAHPPESGQEGVEDPPFFFTMCPTSWMVFIFFVFFCIFEDQLEVCSYFLVETICSVSCLELSADGKLKAYRFQGIDKWSSTWLENKFATVFVGPCWNLGGVEVWSLYSFRDGWMSLDFVSFCV